MLLNASIAVGIVVGLVSFEAGTVGWVIGGLAVAWFLAIAWADLPVVAVELKHPDLRIEVSPEGVSLPRDQYATRAEYVAYRDILSFSFFLEEPPPTIHWLEFKTATGTFFVYMIKLSREDFRDVCTAIVEGIRIAHPDRPAPSLPTEKYWNL